jgi:hypothetical protein
MVNVIFSLTGQQAPKPKGTKMATEVKTEMRKYIYRTADTEKLELLGHHSTIATITKDQALELAQSLISAAMDKDSEDVRVDFEMRNPTRIGDSPDLSLSFGSGLGYVKPKLHWATVEGHQLFELSHEWLRAN